MSKEKPSTSKAVNKPGLLPKLKTFLNGLADRYQRVLQVIDEALASDSLKDKIWAVDLILKRTPMETPATKGQTIKPPAAENLETLNEAELLARIRKHLSSGGDSPGSGL